MSQDVIFVHHKKARREDRRTLDFIPRKDDHINGMLFEGTEDSHDFWVIKSVTLRLDDSPPWVYVQPFSEWPEAA